MCGRCRNSGRMVSAGLGNEEPWDHCLPRPQSQDLWSCSLVALQDFRLQLLPSAQTVIKARKRVPLRKATQLVKNDQKWVKSFEILTPKQVMSRGHTKPFRFPSFSNQLQELLDKLRCCCLCSLWSKMKSSFLPPP